ncbi:uncharacterized protein LOC117650857 [Thrips palmi]|uniref:Uncharacterized protein LOC117650857 n=1 Tax=Thrips palmi TaxID=161013 RepID=A0A6P9A095_THRPL|nr:uncharacterized protein LOC117650857 [Thrips palmi]XP_034250362.1 uncharacterized protein LOC117650857 [Thrips palmi]
MNIYYERGRQEGSHFYHVGDGFYYNVNHISNNSISFRCNRSSCPGRAKCVGGRFLHTIAHVHGPDPFLREVLAARRAIIDQARSPTYVTFGEIIATERARLENRYVRSQLTMRRLRPAMQRARSGTFPNLPQNLAELSAILQNPDWEALTMTLDEEDSMYLGSTWSEDGSHNIIFASKRCLQLMRMASVIFADGTFFIKPSVDGCYQVFTIVTIYGNTVVPLCWCLMESKTESAYIAVLLLLRTHLIWWSFERVICDFEDAMIAAFSMVFQVPVQGCLFHAVSAMSKHARTNIGVPFIQALEVQMVVRLCCSLPLLPSDFLHRGLNIIGQLALETFHPLLYAVVRPFLAYILHEWLGHINRGATLSVSGSVHRTNNASESNNGMMKRRFGVHHPNIYHFLGKLKNFEDSMIDDIYSLSLGLIPSRHRTVAAVSNDLYIQQLTTQLLQDPSDFQILNFLFAACYSVENVVNDNLQL